MINPFSATLFWANISSDTGAHTNTLRNQFVFVALTVLAAMLLILLLIYFISRKHQKRDKTLYARTLKTAEGDYRSHARAAKKSKNFYYEFSDTPSNDTTIPEIIPLRKVEITKIETQEIARSVEILEVDIEIQLEIETEPPETRV